MHIVYLTTWILLICNMVVNGVYSLVYKCMECDRTLCIAMTAWWQVLHEHEHKREEQLSIQCEAE